MPNHVSQRVVIVGPTDAVERFRKVHFSSGSEVNTLKEIDCQKTWIQTLEAELNDPALDEKKRENKEIRLGYARNRIDDLKTLLEEIRSGEPGREFCFETFFGAPDFTFKEPIGLERQRANSRNWYAHNTSRWGTKWNAYDCGEIKMEEIEPGKTRLEFDFSTAWSTPDPIYALINQAWPDLDITVAYIDEGWNFWGIRRMYDGVVTDDMYQDYRDDLEALKLLIWLERNLRGRDDDDLDEMFEESESAQELITGSGLVLKELGLESPLTN